MSFSFNENFNKFYPKYSTDLIEVKTPDRMINNEWDFYDYYKEKNSIYLKNNFEQLIKDFISKLKFVFFNIHKDGSLDLNSVSEIKISNIMNKIIINFSILTFLIFIFKHSLFEKNILNNLNYRNNLYFFLFSLSIAPHLYEQLQHLVGITNVCIIYVILQNESKIEKFIKFIKNLMKILHISFSDYIGGASRAALRIHLILLIKLIQIFSCKNLQNHKKVAQINQNKAFYLIKYFE